MNHLLAFHPTASWDRPHQSSVLVSQLVPHTMTSALSRWASPKMKNLKQRCRERFHSLRPGPTSANMTRKISTRTFIGSRKTFKQRCRRLFRRSSQPDTTPGTPIIPHAPTEPTPTQTLCVEAVVSPTFPSLPNLSIADIPPQFVKRGRDILSECPLNVQ